MQNLQRNVALTFRVTEKERDIIRQKMKLADVSNMRAYLLKMALEGRIIRVELDSVIEMVRLMSNFTNSFNQIAKRVNETGNIYEIDIDDIKGYINKIWERINEVLRRLSNIK